MVPDKIAVERSFRKVFGRGINWEAPQTFNEKLQWLKIYNRDPACTAMVDKFEAKKLVSGIIGQEHVIPTLGVWDKFEDIDFDALPEQFVLKCTHDSGSVKVVRSKVGFDKDAARRFFREKLSSNFYLMNREWPYKNVKPRIIAEKYLRQKDGEKLVDYKFYCFGGTPEFLYISRGLEDHSSAQISFLYMDWSPAPVKRPDYAPFDVLPEKPGSFDEMAALSSRLSKGFPFVRIDMYCVDGTVFFSEFTFFPMSGLMIFDPPEYDEKFGRLLKLPEKHGNGTHAASS